MNDMNEHAQAGQASTTQRPVSASGFPSYLIGDIGFISRQGRVTDLALAAYLRHADANDCTLLYRWTAPDGETFDLKLRGHALFEAIDGAAGETRSYSSADGLVPELLAAATASPPSLKVRAWPFLEWVSERGDPTGAEYDSIWASPSDEVAWLASLIQRD